MNIYSFEISQLPDDAIKWVATECKQQLDTSPIFFGSVGNACLDEIQRRRLNPDGPPTELQIPWIADNVEHYIAACQLVTLAMLAAHEGQNYLLRNFFDVIREILYDQATQPSQTTTQQGALH